MKKIYSTKAGFIVTILSLGILLSSNSVYAHETEVTLGVSASSTVLDARLQTRITKGKEKAGQEIDRRIRVLDELGTHIRNMTRVSSNVKASIFADIENQINILTNLKAKILADTDLDTLKTDIKSITQSYRIFMLIMPKARIIAASDVVKTTAGWVDEFALKLETKISLAGSAGNNTTEMLALLLDMKAKTADSKVQADEAVALVVDLKPDNGDDVVRKSNSEALSSAKAKLKIAKTDLEKAREDARKIVKLLKSIKIGVTASSTTSVN